MLHKSDLDGIVCYMDVFSAWVFAIASSPWALVVLAVLLVIDGFFPLVPGETTVVALATLGAAGHGPAPWAVLLVAIFATMAGDAVAFFIGRRLGTVRFRPVGGRHFAALSARAADLLARRPAFVLIAAKFVPLARVAVVIAAGAGALRLGRYLQISFAASVLYTGYHVLVAMVAGTLLAANPVLALACSLGFGILAAGAIAGTRTMWNSRGRSVGRRVSLRFSAAIARRDAVRRRDALRHMGKRQGARKPRRALPSA